MPHSVEVGQPFPAFSLPCIAAENGEFQEVTVDNATLSGKPYVLFIYPRDNTSGCTVEACNFRDFNAEFQKLGVAVYGLSRDTLRSHKGFIIKQELPYPLLADDGGVWLRENGFLYDAKMYGKPVTKVARTSFYVDGEGIVQKIWDSVTPADHAEDVLGWVRENTA